MIVNAYSVLMLFMAGTGLVLASHIGGNGDVGGMAGPHQPRATAN